MSQRFLGRQYDPATNTWAFKDGTGRVPDEMRQDLMIAIEDQSLGGNGVPVLSTLFDWKKRLGLGA